MSRQINVVMVSAFPDKPSTPRGGVEAAAEILANSLCNLENINLQVIGISDKSSANVEERNGYKIHWIAKPRFRLPGFIAYWTTQRRLIHQMLKVLDPDVVHFQGIAGWGLGYKKPYVLTIHGILENDILHSNKPFKAFRAWIVRQVESFGRRMAHRVIVINPYVLEQLGGVLLGHKEFIENPVADDYFSIQRNCVKNNILCVSRVIPRKNIDGLIRAFQIVKNSIPDACLQIIGPCDDIDYFNSCQDLIKRLNLEEDVLFLGIQNRKAISDYLSQAGCMVLVSLQETAPIALSEAMAAGLPVVASKICGMPYMIDEGITGWLVDNSDVNQIAKRLIDALNLKSIDPKYAKSRYDSLSVAQRTFAVYQSLYKGSIR
jgi:glycosyltransferase involved in cell wall biosynthesis